MALGGLPLSALAGLKVSATAGATASASASAAASLNLQAAARADLAAAARLAMMMRLTASASGLLAPPGSCGACVIALPSANAAVSRS